jgi:hypothetical protein
MFKKLAILYFVTSLFVFTHALNNAFSCYPSEQAVVGAFMAALFAPFYAAADIYYKHHYGIKYDCEKVSEDKGE